MQEDKIHRIVNENIRRVLNESAPTIDSYEPYEYSVNGQWYEQGDENSYCFSKYANGLFLYLRGGYHNDMFAYYNYCQEHPDVTYNPEDSDLASKIANSTPLSSTKRIPVIYSGRLWFGENNIIDFWEKPASYSSFANDVKENMGINESELASFYVIQHANRPSLVSIKDYFGLDQSSREHVHLLPSGKKDIYWKKQRETAIDKFGSEKPIPGGILPAKYHAMTQQENIKH